MRKLLLTLTALICLSCNKELPEAAVINATNENSDYLVFDDQQEFNTLMNELLANENGSMIATRSSKLQDKLSNGFVSISTIEHRVNERIKTRSFEEDCPEMTIDEFNVMKSKLLLPDPVLHQVLDTTLRIGIGNLLYKITELGTFITTIGNEDELNGLIIKLKNENFKFNPGDTIIQINERVKLGNSFRSRLEDNIANEDVQNSPTTRGADSYDNTWMKEYNVSSYKWEGRTWFSNLWSSIWGKDHSREYYFSSDRRMKVVAFNTTYFFWHSAGVKVEMEERKKFWFVKYWVDCFADDFAIGFFRMTGELTISSPPSAIYKTRSDSWNNFTGYFNNKLQNFVYAGYNEIGIIQDFTKKAHTFVPEIPFDIIGKDIMDKKLKDIAQNILDAPKEQIYKFLNNQVENKIIEPLKTKIQPKDPRVLLLHWGSSKLDLNLTGVVESPRAKTKVIRFVNSGGFYINLKGGNVNDVGAWIPMSFKFKDLDFFGAARYQGTWRGIRFYL